jgi:O-antigen/teichoic acid export membrane protein
MEYIALFRILGAVMTFSGVLLFVRIKEDILMAVLVYSISNLAVSAVSLFIVHRLFMKFRIKINIERLKKLISDAIPLVISGFMIVIYYNLDIIMLQYMKSEFEVGIYSAAYKIYFVFIIPFALIFQSYQPKLTTLISEMSALNKSVLKGYSALMLTAAILGGSTLFFLGKWIVLTLYNSGYLLAAGPLSILSMNILIVGINMLFGNPLTVWGKQKLYTVAVTSGALCNITLNILLIPKYSYIGAAFATLLSEVAVFIGVFIIFNRIIYRLSLK